MGWVKAKIVDEFGNQTEEMNMRAFLTPADVVPIIIGFKDFLEKFQVYFDPIKGTGYVE